MQPALLLVTLLRLSLSRFKVTSDMIYYRGEETDGGRHPTSDRDKTFARQPTNATSKELSCNARGRRVVI